MAVRSVNRSKNRGDGTIKKVFNPLHHAGKLYQQFLVHAYCRVEAQNLYYVKTHQKDFRVECYQGLVDYLAHAAQERNLRPGNLAILPSTFTGGPRYMREKYLDAMTIVKRFGRPVYFITFTCNPQWKEIADKEREVLEDYQVSQFIFFLMQVFKRVFPFFRLRAIDQTWRLESSC